MKCLAVLILAITPACGSDSSCADCSAAGAGGGGGVAGSGGSGGGVDAGTSLAQQYCNCMLTSCHDAYHDTFGPETDEVAARENCLTEAAALPSAGQTVSSGNFVECRLHFCQLGASNVSVCPDSVGQGTCK
jgi:hypothetical protein